MAAADPTGSSPLEATCFHVSRAYFHYVSLLERVLDDLHLAKAIRPGMGHVLFALFEHDHLIIKDLVQRTSLAPSTLTGILDKMERAELVARVADPSDGRAFRIALTRRGRGLRERCMEALGRVSAVMEAGLSAVEIKQAKKALAACHTPSTTASGTP